ncbi:MAG TPA: helix-turn-helix domain-containing protein [Planctomycetaceae bacterium]|nr:helix-turn-helix domain-containing protein [Planctomycetaceae bacterium]
MAKQGRRKISLDGWLNSVTTPVYFIDARRRVRFFNHGCVTLFAWESAEVLGKICDYHSEDSGVDQFLGTLCPPPSVFEGQGCSVPAYLKHRQGREIACVQEFFPLVDENQHVEGVLVVLSKLNSPRKPPAPTLSQKLHAELASLRQSMRKTYQSSAFLGRSPEAKRVLAQIRLAQTSNAGVWISGESGIGREHVARIIHYADEAASRAFVPLDCQHTAAIDLRSTWKRLMAFLEEPGPETSLHPGTLFLIDAETMPRDLQEAVVAFLDHRRSAVTGHGSFRIIAASSAPPHRIKQSDELLPEYLLALSELMIEIPPLRKRPLDIELLAQYLLENSNRGEERQFEGFHEKVLRLFEKYHWPGNVRELQTVIRESRQVSSGPLITEDDLPFRFRTGIAAQVEGPPPNAGFVPLEVHLEQVEREHILAALEAVGFVKSKAADLLGIPRPKLYRRLESLGIGDLDDA